MKAKLNRGPSIVIDVRTLGLHRTDVSSNDSRNVSHRQFQNHKNQISPEFYSSCSKSLPAEGTKLWFQMSVQWSWVEVAMVLRAQVEQYA